MNAEQALIGEYYTASCDAPRLTLCCGVNGSPARVKHAHNPAASKQYTTVLGDQLGPHFLLSSHDCP